MKYLITENRINNLIEQYILSTYPEVFKVYFEIIQVYLGSNNKLIDTTKINIIIDNSNNSKNYLVLGALRKQIIENVDNVFGLNWKKYGSGWDFEVNQLCVRPLGKIS